MIKSWQDGEIVCIKITGEFLAAEIGSETRKWYQSKADQYVGYLVDITDMTKQSAVEQKKAEEESRKANTGKPRALLGKDKATAALVNIYKRFTGAKEMRYFTDETEAREWIMSFKN